MLQKQLRALLRDGPKTTMDLSQATGVYPQRLRYHLKAIGAQPIRTVPYGTNSRTVIWEMPK